MLNSIFTGAGVAIITPMNPDGSVNYDVFGQLIDFQIENKTDALVVCGTTGEASTLGDQEHVDVIEYAVKRANGRVPVIGGTGSNDTAYAIWLSKEAEKVGADALLQVTPYYNKTSQAGLISHFTAIADSVELPIILYNVPSRTGVNIQPKTYAELAKHPNIRAIKEANGNISELAHTMALCGDKLDVYSGNDDQITSFMSLGAKGVISVLSNVAPAATHEICARFFAGDVSGSAKLQLEYLDLVDAMFCDVNPIPVKAAMTLMGYNVGECRLPLVAPSGDNLEKIRAALKNHGII